MSEYLTPEQVAERFQVTAKTVRDWLRTGELVGVKLGRSWRIKESDLDRMVEMERLNVLVERAQRKYPGTTWRVGQCSQCGESIPVPAKMGIWVCSPKCKAEHDEEAATLVGRNSEEYITSRADVIPPV
ncbi:MAG: helix-turn-helix domain-containing protein [Bacillota bacterium]